MKQRLKIQNWYIITFFLIAITCIVISDRYGDVILGGDFRVGEEVECYYDGGDIYSSNLVSGVVLYSQGDWIVASGTCIDFEQIITEQGPGVSNVYMKEIGTRQCEDTKLKINCNRLEPIGKYKDMIKNAKIWYGVD